MATPAAVSAVIRAYRPTFKNDHDKLAFAVHAILSVAGCRLLAVGPQADMAGTSVCESLDEAPIQGWDATSAPEAGGYYSFLYAVPQQATKPGVTSPVLLVKAVPLGDQLLVTFTLDPCPDGHIPSTLELQVDKFCDGSQHGTYAYTNLEQVIQLVQTVLDNQLSSHKATGQSVTSSTSAQANTTGVDVPSLPSHGQGSQEKREDPLRDYSQPGRQPPRGCYPGQPYPYGDPLSVGGGDRMPGGVPMPGRRPDYGPLGGPGGGMHVGPEHPMFGGGGMFPGPGIAPRPGFGGAGSTGGPGPGMRWDPIAPPGLPGYRPDDFVPGGPGRGGQGGVHPDIMQPGAGRGTDWDHMFG